MTCTKTKHSGLYESHVHKMMLCTVVRSTVHLAEKSFTNSKQVCIANPPNSLVLPSLHVLLYLLVCLNFLEHSVHSELRHLLNSCTPTSQPCSVDPACPPPRAGVPSHNCIYMYCGTNRITANPPHSLVLAALHALFHPCFFHTLQALIE